MTETINTKYYDTEFVISSTGHRSTDLRMDPVEKKRWTDALRSGKYSQAQGYLTVVGKGSCCLGVYCEIEDMPKRRVYEHAGTNYNYNMLEVFVYGGKAGDPLASPVEGTSSTFVPPTHAIKLYDKDGVESGSFTGRTEIFMTTVQGREDGRYGPQVNDVWLPKPGTTRGITLPLLNDDGFTFAQIADVIDYFL